ncbi:MAG: ribonuclease HI [Nitrososphaerota archaeon]
MIEVYIDGLTEPVNPGGITTYAFVVYENREKLHEQADIVGQGEGFSNNVGEYAALLAALRWLLENNLTSGIEIKSDSRLLVNQMNGVWKVRRGYYIKTLEQVKEVLKEFQNIKFIWIPREENTEADMLSRMAYERYRR